MRYADAGPRGGTWRLGWPRAAPLLVAALALLVAPEGAWAQRRGEGPPGPDRAEMQRRIQARFGAIVREQLGLGPDEQRALMGVMREAERQRRALQLRETALRAQLRSEAALVPARGAPPLLPEDDARAILEEMRAIREQELRLFGAEQERLLQILTPPQLVRFYALREQLAHRVRQLRQGPGGMGPPRGPGALPPDGGR